MKIDLRSAQIGLSADAPLRLDDGRGVIVRCMDGTLWITQTGVTEDIFLLPGQNYRIERDGLSLIESIGEAKLILEKSGLIPGWYRRISAIKALLISGNRPALLQLG